MAEGERLFPRDEQSGREGPACSCSGGDGMMLVEHAADGGGKPIGQAAARSGGSPAAVRDGGPDRGAPRLGGRRGPAPAQRSDDARARQRRGVRRIEGLHGDHVARRRRLAAAGVAMGGIQTAAADAAARRQSPAGLDPRLQGRRAGRIGVRGGNKVHRVAGAWARSRCAFRENYMWDAKKMRFSNSEEANKLLKPSLRKGWDLKV